MVDIAQINEDENQQLDSESPGGATAGRVSSRAKKKGRRVITDVIIHVYAPFNNTLITVTDVKGNTLSWATAGGCGFRGSRKSTPFAGQAAAAKAIQAACAMYGAKSAEIRIYGPGPGREAIRAVRDHVQVTGIYDITGYAFNGVRAPKRRRV